MIFKNNPSVLLTVILSVLLATSAHAEKTDVVILVNGNAVTGEVKSLEFGSLRYSTDSMGTVNIDWEDIVSVASNQQMQVELQNGKRYFGTLEPVSDSQSSIAVVVANVGVQLDMKQVVRITPIETSARFLDRLDGSFSLGFQTQKSSEVTTSNIAADVSYRTQKYLVGLQLNSTVTDQPSEETKARQRVQTNYQRFRPNRWFTDWFTSWEKNDELGISSRVSLGGALGRYIVQTNKNQFSLTAGLQAARESFTGEDESSTVGEGRIEIRYLRRNLLPETSIIFTSKIYPTLDDFSRFRAETDLTLKREFIPDFFFEFGLGHSYISEPPTDAESEDYVATMSLGYSF